LIPTIKALETLKANEPIHKRSTQELVMDTFKILCLLVKQANTTRAEKLKKEMKPQYRQIFNVPASATSLIGDNLQESLKKLEGPKLTTSQIPFYGKTAGKMNQHNPPQTSTKGSSKTFAVLQG
jgi:hypothetical protein